MAKQKTGDVVNLRVRFPRGVLKAVKVSAQRNQRSQNAEIVFRLAEALGVVESGRSDIAAVSR